MAVAAPSSLLGVGYEAFELVELGHDLVAREHGGELLVAELGEAVDHAPLDLLEDVRRLRGDGGVARGEVVEGDLGQGVVEGEVEHFGEALGAGAGGGCCVAVRERGGGCRVWVLLWWL